MNLHDGVPDMREDYSGGIYPGRNRGLQRLRRLVLVVRSHPGTTPGIEPDCQWTKERKKKNESEMRGKTLFSPFK